MNSTLTTYRPRGRFLSTNDPSAAVAALYFFPVNVFAAVTVTPGNVSSRSSPFLLSETKSAEAVVALPSLEVGGFLPSRKTHNYHRAD